MVWRLLSILWNKLGKSLPSFKFLIIASPQKKPVKILIQKDYWNFPDEMKEIHKTKIVSMSKRTKAKCKKVKPSFKFPEEPSHFNVQYSA